MTKYEERAIAKKIPTIKHVGSEWWVKKVLECWMGKSWVGTKEVLDGYKRRAGWVKESAGWVKKVLDG